MFRRKRSVDPGMTVHAEMPEIETDTSRMSRRERRAAQKAAKREAKEAAKRKAAHREAVARRKAAAKKRGARKSAKRKPQAEKQNKRAISAQATIPYREMGKDGICRVHDRLYSKTIRYLDLNYQLAQPDDKADIFDGWSEFLNYFDYTIHAQLTFSNRHSIAAELENLIKVRPRNDRFADLMEEYADMLREQLQKGNNGLIRTKYITYSIEADNFREAKQLKTPNGLILGTPGSGKSFTAKREIAHVFFFSEDDVIICDPEGEYYPLVQALGGQVVRIAPSSHDYINPLDFNLDYSDDENPLRLKSDFILSLCELIMGSRSGIDPKEKSVIDRCLAIIYDKYLRDPCPENIPILGDLYNCLLKQPEKEAAYIATALEIYVTGSLNVFNHQTNVELTNRIVCFDIKDLGKQLKKLGMLIVQDQVWNRVTVNRFSHKATRYYIDEFHLLLKEEQTASYSIDIWKRFRKWGGIPTGITQNVKDLLASREIENIFENSDFIIMLNQAGGDRAILAKQLNISPRQLSHVTNSQEGEGLLFYGNVIIPFRDRFDKSTRLYSLMTTKPEEVQARMAMEHEENGHEETSLP